MISLKGKTCLFFNRKFLISVSILAIVLLTGNNFSVSAKSNFVKMLFPSIDWYISPSDPFIQTWSNPSLITVNNNWDNVIAIDGYRGDGLTTSAGTDPQTILADGSGTPLNVIANQSNPNTLTTGGVAEFDGIANPTIALQGDNTASAPHIVIRLNKKSCPEDKRISIGYKVRDIESSTDDAVQAVALQYRVGTSGNFINLPGAFVADATDPNQATKVLTVFATLPFIPQAQENVHIRIITANAVGNDEWVGIDDINIGCFAPLSADASISGRVMSPYGQPLPKAIVSMTDENGIVRTVLTNQFGYYRFDYISVGGIVILNVSSKQYQFEPQIFSVVSDMENIDFEGQP